MEWLWISSIYWENSERKANNNNVAYKWKIKIYCRPPACVLPNKNIYSITNVQEFEYGLPPQKCSISRTCMTSQFESEKQRHGAAKLICKFFRIPGVVNTEAPDVPPRITRKWKSNEAVRVGLECRKVKYGIFPRIEHCYFWNVLHSWPELSLTWHSVMDKIASSELHWNLKFKELKKSCHICLAWRLKMPRVTFDTGICGS